ILSASDRYNYGDLLFPIVTQKALSKFGEFEFEDVACIKSNMIKFGGLRTKSYKFLIKEAKLVDYDKTLIIAGGEVLMASWIPLYGFIFRWYRWLMHRIKQKWVKSIVTKLLF